MGCPAPRRESDRPGRRPRVPGPHVSGEGAGRLRAGLRLLRRRYPHPGHARPAAVAGAVTLFANPCPVCGVTDEHAAWRVGVGGSPATFCPHPGEPGHGTGCCCAGRPTWPYRLTLAAAGAPSLEERVAALEATVQLFARKLFERGDITINDVRSEEHTSEL